MAVRRSKQASSRSRSVSNGKRAADTSERAYKAIRHLLVEFRLRPEERINERTCRPRAPRRAQFW